jgi:hypothetical protein
MMMNRYFLGLLLLASVNQLALAQNNPLWGRWEVLKYSEQGVQVDKKAPAGPQAREVYAHVRKWRAERWYGHYEYSDYTRREEKAFERWLEADSLLETSRVAEAISTPFYVVFFADSTLSMYNKTPETNRILYPEVRHYTYYAATKSIDISPGVGLDYSPKTDAQILQISDTEMTLYLPETAEIVLLKKTEFSVP